MRLSSFVLIGAALVVCVSARSTPNVQNAIPEAGRSQDTGLHMSDLRFIYKTYQECSGSDISACLKLKLITALDRAARNIADINLFDGISFVKDPSAQIANTVPATESELEASLPRAMDDRENTLNELILEKTFNFFKSHILQVLKH